MSLLFFFGEPAHTEASAGVAAGVGAASSISSTLAATAGQGAGTGTGLQPNRTINASIQAAAGTGAANNATATQSVNATAELASGVGEAAFGVSASLAAGPSQAAGTSESYEPTIPDPVDVFPFTAEGTGAANNATCKIALTAQAALGAESLTAVVTDTFSRSVSNAMGSADSGQAWVTQGTFSDYDIDGSSAVFTHLSGTTLRRAWLSSVVAHDMEMSAKWKASSLAISSHEVFLSLRQSAVDGDFLLPRITVATNQAMTLSLYRRAAGVETEIVSRVLDLTFEADTYYTLKTRLVGQGFFAKAWKSSDSEPGWLVSATDTQISAPGGVGMRSYSPPGGSYPLTFSWDDLGVNQLTSVGQALQPTITANASVNAAAIEATGTGSTNELSVTLQPNAAAASGAGASYALSSTNAAGIGVAEGLGASADPTFGMAVNAEASAATGEAYALESAASLTAGLATGTGDAANIVPALGPSAVAAEGVGASSDTTSAIAANIAAAQATGAAYLAAGSITMYGFAGHATGVGVAYDASPWTGLPAGAVSTIRGATVPAMTLQAYDKAPVIASARTDTPTIMEVR